VYVEIGSAVVIEQAVDRHLEVCAGNNVAVDQVVLIVVGADRPKSVTQERWQLVAVVVRVAAFGVQEDRARRGVRPVAGKRLIGEQHHVLADLAGSQAVSARCAGLVEGDASAGSCSARDLVTTDLSGRGVDGCDGEGHAQSTFRSRAM